MDRNIKPANDCLGIKYAFAPRGDFKETAVRISDRTVYAVNGTAQNGKQKVCVLSFSPDCNEAEVTVIAVMNTAEGSVWVCTYDEFLGTEICFECNLKAVFKDGYELAEVLYEKTCGAVMFTEKDGERLYLLIKNDSGHIGFPKGHVEYGEDEIQTVIREVKEETALDAKPVPDFRMAYSYTNTAGHRKTAVYYLSHYDYTTAVIQKEEIYDSWLLPYNEAVKLLNYPQDIPVLEGAEKFIG